MAGAPGVITASSPTASDRANFNYTAIREISPGRLLYMHDGQVPGSLARINSLYIDVERLKK